MMSRAKCEVNVGRGPAHEYTREVLWVAVNLCVQPGSYTTSGRGERRG